MKIKSVAVLGAGAVGSYVIWGLSEKLEKLYPESKYVTRLMTYSWGQKVIRFYDLDGNLIEVRTPMRG